MASPEDFNATVERLAQKYPSVDRRTLAEGLMQSMQPEPSESALGQWYRTRVAEPVTNVVSGGLQKGGKALGILPTPAPVQSGDPLSGDAMAQESYNKRTMDPVAQAIVPQTPAQAGALIAGIAAGPVAKALGAGAGLQGTARMLGGPTGGAIANMADKGATLTNATEGAVQGAPGTAAEAMHLTGRIASNANRTMNPTKGANKLASEWIKGLSDDMDLPNFGQRLTALSGKQESNALLATEQVRNVMGEVIDKAEKRIVAAMGGPDMPLNMPSLTKMKNAPSTQNLNQVLGGAPAPTLAQPPTVAEAFAAVKKAKAEARYVREHGMGDAEPQLAVEKMQKARDMQVEFDRAVDQALAGKSSANSIMLQRARTQFARGMDVLDVLAHPEVFKQGKGGVWVDQPGLGAAMRAEQQMGGFSAQNFPNAVKAAARGGPDFATDEPIRLPFMSTGGMDPHGRVGLSGMHLTRFAGPTSSVAPTVGQAVGPSALRSMKAIIEQQQPQ